MNGATEATLADLLATAQAMNVNLIKLQQLFKSSSGASGGAGGAGGTTGSAASSIAGVASSLNPLGIAFGVLKGAASAVGAVFGVMGSILGQVVGVATGLVKSLYSLGAATAITGTKISEFYDAFKGVPLLGIGFGILADVMRYQEQLLDFFQQVAVNGASFSGSLTEMKAAASRSYMSMQDFAAVVKENNDLFATMGGTVTAGVNKFVDVQNKMLGPRSEYANLMYGMGFNAKTAGDFLASYMRTQGVLNKQEQESTESIIKGTVEYAKELNIVSQLTGMNNAELRKKVEKIQSEAAFEAFKMNKSKAYIEASSAAIANMVAERGEQAGIWLRNTLMGISTPLNEAQDEQQIMSRGRAMELNQQLARMINQERSVKEIGDASRKGNLAVMTEVFKTFNALGPVAATMVNENFAVGAAFMRQQKDSTNLIKNENTARTNQVNAAKGNAAALERAEQGMRNFGEQILMLAYQIIAPFIPLLQGFANGVVGFGRDLAGLATKIAGSGGFKDAVEGVVNWFRTTFRTLSTSTDAGDFFNKLGGRLGVAFDAIKPILVSIFEKFVEFFKPYAIDMVNVVEDYVNAILFKKFGYAAIAGAEDPEIRKQQRTAEKLSLEATRLTSAAEQLRKDGANQTLIDQAVAAAIAKNKEAAAANEVYKATNAARSPRGPRGVGGDGTFMRHKGTIGMTGNWWEKSDATLDIQEGESVVTKEQMAQIVGAAGQNGLAESIQQLNSLVALQVKYARETAEYARRNVDATRSLDGNQFARA